MKCNNIWKVCIAHDVTKSRVGKGFIENIRKKSKLNTSVHMHAYIQTPNK